MQWCDSVIVFDSGSTDATQAIAHAAGATVIENPFQNYAQQRNDALQAAESEWVLFVDADERSSPEQGTEIRSLLQNPHHDGYGVPRHNYIFGKLTRHTGWFPDYQVRLLKRSAARYDPQRQVHEIVILTGGEPGTIDTPFVHYNYDSVTQFHAKQRRYVAYDAQILLEQGTRPKFYTPYTQPLRHFKWRFFDLAGYKDGLHGLHLSLLMSYYEFRKYRVLQRLLNQFGQDV